LKIKKIDISSIFPIIINKIKLIFEDVNRLEKFILLMSYISELTVLVKVKIDSLKDFSKPILSITNKLDKIKRLRKKEMNRRNDIFTFSSVIFLSELKIVLFITLFGLISLIISNEVIFNKI
jgi:GTP-binding protein EngB required for normal cell division